MRTDVRPLLPTIRCPTLFVHHRDHPAFPVEASRLAATLVPGTDVVGEPRGEPLLRGVPGTWAVFAVGGRPPA
jgi:hypothetical protein